MRWFARTGDGRSRGPLSRDAVRDQLVRGALMASDQISREGGAWTRLDEHVDFRAHFIPGTPACDFLDSAQAEARRSRASGSLRRRARRLLAVGAAVAGIGLAFGSFRGGWFVIPEPAAVRVEQLANEARSAISDRIASAVDEDVAARSVRSTRELPGATLVAEAEAAHPWIEGPAALHIALGRAALWQGTRGSADEARLHFERALVLAPWDAEAASGLAQSLSGLHGQDPTLGSEMAVAAERADAAAPDSIAGLQARAAVARASGREALALDLAARCGAPPARAGLPGADVDLWCAVTTAALEPNPGALAELEA
ncbi:MAG: hypothetical protein VX265_10795, partial [Myxococcota bacterium]|nr:hypothetical protein [Myxococcota bacterium]